MNTVHPRQRVASDTRPGGTAEPLRVLSVRELAAESFELSLSRRSCRAAFDRLRQQPPLTVDDRGHQPQRQPALPRCASHSDAAGSLRRSRHAPARVLSRLPVDHLRLGISPERSAPPSDWLPCRCARRPWLRRAALRHTRSVYSPFANFASECRWYCASIQRRCAAGQPAPSARSCARSNGWPPPRDHGRRAPPRGVLGQPECRGSAITSPAPAAPARPCHGPARR